MKLHPTSWYTKQLKKALPAATFDPARSRVAWAGLLVVGVGVAITAIGEGWVSWPLMLLCSLGVGVAFGCLAFLAHEALHGAIVRTSWLKYLLGFVGFLPFVVSPRLWMAWHNRAHHDETARPGLDPDAYPTLREYENSRTLRFVTNHFAMGRGRTMGWLSLILGFTGQSLQILFGAHRTGLLSRREQLKAAAETTAGVALWVTLAVLVGFWSFLLAFFLPLLIGNAMLMAFILTNHNLSPTTETNDPLVNSLSVSGPRWFEWLTLNFGYHVEHHLFRSMSPRHAPRLRELILERWPERYQTLPLWTALKQLHASPRVYKDDTTLLDPLTGVEWPLQEPEAALSDSAAGALGGAGS